jgi:hypothetical protein
LSGGKVVKREVELVLPVGGFLRLFGLGEDDRRLDVGLGFGGAIEFWEWVREFVSDRLCNSEVLLAGHRSRES